MDNNGLFRVALFGGYNKADVMEYTKTLEGEIEAIKAMHLKERQELMQKLDSARSQGGDGQLQKNLEDANAALKAAEAACALAEEEKQTLQKANAELEKQLKEALERADREIPAPADDGKAQALAEAQARVQDLELQLENTQQMLLEASTPQVQPVMTLHRSGERPEENARQDELEISLAKKVLEDAYRNADAIGEEAARNAAAVLEQANAQREKLLKEVEAEAESYRAALVKQINDDMKNRGLEMLRARHRVEHYLSRLDGVMEGFTKVHDELSSIADSMPTRIDHLYKENEKPVEEAQHLQAQ